MNSENAMNLIRATKQYKVVRSADPVQWGAGRMAYTASDEVYVTHRGMKQHRSVQGRRSNQGCRTTLRAFDREQGVRAHNVKRGVTEGCPASDGLRFSDEAANPRGAKRPTIVESCQEVTGAMQGASNR